MPVGPVAVRALATERDGQGIRPGVGHGLAPIDADNRRTKVARREHIDQQATGSVVPMLKHNRGRLAGLASGLITSPRLGIRVCRRGPGVVARGLDRGQGGTKPGPGREEEKPPDSRAAGPRPEVLGGLLRPTSRRHARGGRPAASRGDVPDDDVPGTDQARLKQCRSNLSSLGGGVNEGIRS